MSSQTLPRTPQRNAFELYVRAYWRVYLASGLWSVGVYALFR